MEWTEDTIASLRRFWGEGHSTAEIGRRLGVTKNAVVGKAHRLTLAPRPSPIRREAGLVPQPRRATGPTLPPPAPAAGTAPAEPASLPPLPVPPPAPVAAEAPERGPLRPVAPGRGGRVSTCCWPIGEPGTRSFRFCDDTAMAGRPYCEAHALLAYVKVRDRREDAA